MLNTVEINEWRRKNSRLFHQHPEKWVAFNPAQGILASHRNLEELVKSLQENKGLTPRDYILKFVHSEEVPVRPIKLYPLRIHAVRKHEWRPDFPIELRFGENSLNEMVLVDSGADISVISNDTGRLLGLSLADGEIRLEAAGVGGGVLFYALRQITLLINGYRVDAPVAWLQDPLISELILGREVVFDEFDIEFRQADEEIIFTKRSPKPLRNG